MSTLPDFKIGPNGILSRACLSRDIRTFHQAVELVQGLAYGRNADKSDLMAVFTDNKGTCSTKHALLKRLAEENHCNRIRLMLGIFKMNAVNTPPVAHTLARHSLEYIPEAHNYLRYGTEIFDFTRKQASPADFKDDLLLEQEISPDEIGDGKIRIHRLFLADWLQENAGIPYSPDALWAIREQCIRDLSGERADLSRIR